MGISNRSTTSAHTPLVHHASEQSQASRSSTVASSFKSALKDVAKGLKRASSGLLGQGAASKLSRLSSSGVAKGLMRMIRLVFPALVSQPQAQQFPHQVSRFMQAPGAEPLTHCSTPELLMQLSECFEQKQGFVLLRGADEPSLGDRVAQCLQEAGGQFQVDEHTVLKSVRFVPNEAREPGAQQWEALVYDSRLDMEVPVPLTELVLDRIDAKTTQDPALGAKLFACKSVMDEHLHGVHDAFIDSPCFPPIVCPRNPRLAQLLTVQEECLSRYYRRMYTSNERSHWIGYVEDVLREPEFGGSVFRGEESCGVEQFFSRLARVERRPDPKVSVGAHPNLQRSDTYYADFARAYKRHLPVTYFDAEHIQPAAAHSEPARVDSASSSSSQPRPVIAQPTASSSSATPNSFRATASSSSASATFVPSTVTPVTHPAWALRANRQAYKQPVQQMLCAKQAFNSLIQGPELGDNDLMQMQVQKYAGVADIFNLPMGQARGLMHPEIIEQLAQHGHATVHKHMFSNVIDPVLEQNHADQWRNLVNLSPQGLNKNWVEHGPALQAIQTLHITTEQWLSAQRGPSMDDLLTLINARLDSNHYNHQHLRLPRYFELSNVAPSTANQLAQQIEADARAAVLPDHPDFTTDFPLVVRCAGAGQAAGHFYTVVPDAQGNWLSLNADGTQQDGVQPCRLWAPAGQLANALIEHGVQQIIHPAL